MEMEVRTSTASHSQDGITGQQNFRAACQQWKWRSEHQQQRTPWMEFQSSRISEQHVSNGNGGQNINSNSQPGWNFRAACQQWKWRSEHQQQLTAWMEFQS